MKNYSYFNRLNSQLAIRRDRDRDKDRDREIERGKDMDTDREIMRESQIDILRAYVIQNMNKLTNKRIIFPGLEEVLADI